MNARQEAHSIRRSSSSEQKVLKGHEVGRCPACGAEKLNYGEKDYTSDGLLRIFWFCEECCRTGYEIYRVEFIGHMEDRDEDKEVYYEEDDE